MFLNNGYQPEATCVLEAVFTLFIIKPYSYNELRLWVGLAVQQGDNICHLTGVSA